MGGFHATLVPDEVIKHCDSILVGDADNVWREIIKDFQNDNLKKVYKHEGQTNLKGLFPDRSIYDGKNYLKIRLIETGRGCKFACNFCSIASFYKSVYNPRPIEDVVEDIKRNRSKLYFFVSFHKTLKKMILKLEIVLYRDSR